MTKMSQDKGLVFGDVVVSNKKHMCAMMDSIPCTILCEKEDLD